MFRRARERESSPEREERVSSPLGVLKRYLAESAKSASSGADQLLSHTRGIISTVMVLEQCSRCGLQVNMLHSITTQNRCRMCNHLYCDACIARSSIEVPFHLLDQSFRKTPPPYIPPTPIHIPGLPPIPIPDMRTVGYGLGGYGGYGYGGYGRYGSGAPLPEKHPVCVHCMPLLVQEGLRLFRRYQERRCEAHLNAYLGPLLSPHHPPQHPHPQHPQMFFYPIPSQPAEDTALRKFGAAVCVDAGGDDGCFEPAAAKPEAVRHRR
ncbi:hypothetical protein B484DRAFT_187229 [Ochromonadaceae sp. CCMP2298]|nr:hypothetical protein B484DRAFT_187229 [Ochromonadaceae sp. CCMP2298]